MKKRWNKTHKIYSSLRDQREMEGKRERGRGRSHRSSSSRVQQVEVDSILLMFY